MFNSEFIAKIEGHGALHVDWRKNDVRLRVLEGERLFEGMLVGRKAEEAHWITPRICGVCPAVHHLVSIKAAESALGIKPSQGTQLLRDLMAAGQIIQSHVLHLFFLALPDYLGLDKGTELSRKKPALFKIALSLKELADEIVFCVGGRNIHPMSSAIGGFLKLPAKKSLEKLLEKMKASQKAAKFAMEFFSSIDYPELDVDLEFVAQQGDFIISNKLSKSLINDYKKDFQEEVKQYSSAKFAKYKRREVLTGALARVLLYDEYGKEYKNKLNFKNPFYNNSAQAIEIYELCQSAQGLTEKLLRMELDHEIQKPTSAAPLKGIGAIEAPRGGLYHELHLDSRGFITYANILTPTVQNLSSIEKSARALLRQTEKLPQRKRSRLLEMLVRAYDPCITCATH